MKWLLIALSILVSNLNLKAQTVMDSSTFDFWVGEWSATWDNGNGTVGKGANKIVKILDEKVIQENFADEAGFKGTSISVFNPTQKKWHQAWADNQGGYFDLEGEVIGDKKIFKTKVKEVNDKKYIQRMLFYDIKPQSFTWDWEKSEDGGNTWTLQWRIGYTKMK
ncbi:hypothetical protein F9K33_09805 [bacterium]|nr:MAG: hypothetical protein F9K33_09805 [bacterium]